jgi:hypothetical protein
VGAAGRPLWGVCDGRHRTLKVDTSGTFATTGVHNRPSGMPNYDNEGLSVAGAGECTAGQKPAHRADDNNDDNHHCAGAPSPADPGSGSPVVLVRPAAARRHRRPVTHLRPPPPA